ncbi:hypothetical protein B0H10DRAFT_2431157 [Mycena sp. CBHHK59/15]|nr:hypothetical protein B0H10DRAFT_2431157 [Mycena sp. CBHHK59/15]
MSSYTPTDSNSVTPGLSAAAPFADVLRARSEDAPLPPSTKALEAAGPPAPPPAYTQKGLGKTHGAGLRNVQDSLVANNGGISSSSHLLPPPPSRPGANDGERLNDPPLGPPSTKRATGAPVVASHSPAADSDHSPTPPPRISTVTHFGMTEYTDAKAETALHMAKRAIQDLHILADALRVNETRVQRLEVDVTKVVIEHRLSHVFPSDDLRSTRPRSPSITQNRSRSPTRGRSRSTTPSHSHSPQPRNRSRSPARSYHDPIDELYMTGIAALEANSSDEGPSAISVKELTVAAARRFTEITSDRNILDSAIKLQAGRLQTINGELRSENKALRKISMRFKKISRLSRLSSLNSSSTPPRPSAVPPILKPPTRTLYTHVILCLLFGLVLQRLISPQNGLSLTDLFVSLIDGTLPTFHFTDSYSVSLDPVFPYHLRVTLKAAADVQSLLKAWGTGARTVGMQEMNSDGSNDPKPHNKRDPQPGNLLGEGAFETTFLAARDDPLSTAIMYTRSGLVASSWSSAIGADSLRQITQGGKTHA